MHPTRSIRTGVLGRSERARQDMHAHRKNELMLDIALKVL